MNRKINRVPCVISEFQINHSFSKKEIESVYVNVEFRDISLADKIRIIYYQFMSLPYPLIPIVPPSALKLPFKIP